MMGEDLQLQEIAMLLKYSRNAVVFTGAGMSTASGIPDFRSPSSGLWNNVDPMAVASIYGFRQNPQAFYEWVYPLTTTALNAQPNVGHEGLAKLEALGIVKCIVTQNIDMLHTRAGSKCVYELHGHMREATCTHCFKVYPAQPILEKFLSDRQVPHCPACNGVIKPNVILFGEQLPHEAFHGAQEAVRKADLVLILGSSLEVAPASELPTLAWRNGAKIVIINLEPTPLDRIACSIVRSNVTDVVPALVRLLEQA